MTNGWIVKVCTYISVAVLRQFWHGNEAGIVWQANELVHMIVENVMDTSDDKTSNPDLQGEESNSRQSPPNKAGSLFLQKFRDFVLMLRSLQLLHFFLDHCIVDVVQSRVQSPV